MMTTSTRVAASSSSSSLAKSTTKSSSRARSTGYPPKAFLSKTTNKTTTTREKDYNSGKKKSRYEVTSCSSSRSSRGTDDNDDGIEEKARSFSSSSSSPMTTTTKLSRRSALFFSSFVAGSGGFAPFASEVETEAKAALAGEQLIDSRTFVSRAMQKFERNDVEGATLDFDALIAKSPGSKPYLWQRGIALYYIDEFREAEKQFREDVKVNPNDTEEAAWAFLSQMRKGGEGGGGGGGGGDVSSTLNKAREEFVELAGRDSRKVMGSVLRLYKTGDEEAKKTLESLSKKPADSTQSASDAFYASLYLGLYSEAIGNAEEAKYWMKKANGTPYGQRASGDFMTSVARVHLARRKWDTIDEDSSDRTRPTGGNVEVVSTHAFDSATRRLERFPFPESFSMRIV
jgi:tetratricopeptide (TPR) repeat protein